MLDSAGSGAPDPACEVSRRRGWASILLSLLIFLNGSLSLKLVAMGVMGFREASRYACLPGSLSGSLADKRSKLRQVSIGKWGLIVSNVIQFLESMGSSAMTARVYGDMTAQLDVDDVTREALLVRDGSALSRILNARQVMICMVAAPVETPQEEEAPAEDGDEEKQDD